MEILVKDLLEELKDNKYLVVDECDHGDVALREKETGMIIYATWDDDDDLYDPLVLDEMVDKKEYIEGLPSQLWTRFVQWAYTTPRDMLRIEDKELDDIICDLENLKIAKANVDKAVKELLEKEN